MPSLLRDFRFGGRILARNPGFTLVAILTLALAIGANTAIFSVTSALLLRPFPYARPQQLVSIAVHADGRDPGGTLMRYELVRDRAHTLSTAAWTNDNFNLTGSGEPVQIPVARVTPNFFSLLGVQPALGRTFLDSDGHPESHPVVLSRTSSGAPASAPAPTSSAPRSRWTAHPAPLSAFYPRTRSSPSSVKPTSSRRATSKLR